MADPGQHVPDPVSEEELERAVLDALGRHPLGLRRADLRAELSAAYAARLLPAELAVLDTRIGHALRRLKTAGEVVHRERRQVYELPERHLPGAATRRELAPPPEADLSGLADAEQDALF